MFSDCSSLKSLDLSNCRINKGKDMSLYVLLLFSLDLSNFKSIIFENIKGIFYGCFSFYINLYNFYTNKVENMSYMFSDSYSLTSLVLSFLI